MHRIPPWVSKHCTHRSTVTIVTKSWELSAEKYLSVRALSAIEEEIIRPILPVSYAALFSSWWACFFPLSLWGLFFFPLSLCWRYQHTQKGPCPGNSPKVSRALCPTMHSACPGGRLILSDPQLRVPVGLTQRYGLPCFFFHDYLLSTQFSSPANQHKLFIFSWTVTANWDSSVYSHTQRCFESTPVNRLPEMHPVPVSACAVMATSDAKIMVAIVLLSPCRTSVCTKMSSPIALLQLWAQQPLEYPWDCYFAIIDMISNARWCIWSLVKDFHLYVLYLKSCIAVGVFQARSFW